MKKGSVASDESQSADAVFDRHLHSLRKNMGGDLWRVLLSMVEREIWEAPMDLHAAYEANPARAEMDLLPKYRMLYMSNLAAVALPVALSHKAARRRGQATKLANDKDGKQAAKKYARELWPEASRNGWTAAKLHSALTGAGHTVAFDTVRKWLTALRKTGVC